MQLNLPTKSGRSEIYVLQGGTSFDVPRNLTFNRIAYSAAHVVADPFADNSPFLEPAIDWDKTIEYRRYLWSLGLGVAEAMDTAQRGMGLDWPMALELIRRSVAASKDFKGARIACGCGTDHLDPDSVKSIDDVISAYEMQMDAIESAGGRLIVMASRALARIARGPDDYARVYDRILSQAKEPVLLHWLGDMFDPALKGYWGSADLSQAEKTCLDVIAGHAAKVDGIKISLLDDRMEIRMRRALPRDVKMYTGDDFNFADLIAGDDQGYSHALLGIFDAIAPAASAALHALNANDLATYKKILSPTVALSRHIFKAPTRFYKSGIVLMAWLNGHQDHFVMVGGQEGARSALHYAELFKLADQAGLLRDPDMAVYRMNLWMGTKGVGEWRQQSQSRIYVA